jgi:chromosome segregation ATPase
MVKMLENYSVYYVSIVVVLFFCLILFLGLLIQKKREEAKRRKEMELLSAQRRLEESREKLAGLRKLLYEIENQLTNNKHYHATKKEELVQVAKKLRGVEEEKLEIQTSIDQTAPSEQEMNILNNRMKLNRENLAELSAEAQDLQTEVEKLGQAVQNNEAEIQELQHKISQAENELEYNRELVKIKERLVKN